MEIREAVLGASATAHLVISIGSVRGTFTQSLSDLLYILYEIRCIHPARMEIMSHYWTPLQPNPTVIMPLVIMKKVPLQVSND